MVNQERAFFRILRSGVQTKLTLWHLSIVLVLVGTVVSGYLSYVRIADVPLVCSSGEIVNCDIVQNSRYARLLGIPVAYLGFLGYVMIGVVLYAQHQIAAFRESGIYILFGLVSAAFLFSMYLVYAQGVLLGAWCIWCVQHEVAISILFAVTAYRLCHY